MKSILIGLFGLLVVFNAHALNIVIDYTYDEAYFDGNPTAKNAMDAAAADLGQALTAALNADLGDVSTDIFTGMSNKATVMFDWHLSFKNPSNLEGANITLPTFPSPAGTFKIYAGAVDTISGEQVLGAAAPANADYDDPTFGGSGSDPQYVTAFQNTVNLSNRVLLRGAGPRISSAPVDFEGVTYTVRIGLLAGFVTFSKAKASSFHFDHTTLPVSKANGGNKYDFYTVMLHEMIHALGFGTSETWRSLIGPDGTTWLGPNVILDRGTGANLIHPFYDNDNDKPDGAHLANGLMSTTVVGGVSQEAVMTSDLSVGERRKITALDIAFLKDLGHGPTPTPVPATPTPTPTPTPEPKSAPAPEPAPPDAPILAGKTKVTTAKPKIKIGGSLLAPGAYVMYKIGSGPYIKAKGTTSWAINLKLKPGKNIIFIVTFDPATKKMSAPIKVTITRAAAR